MSQRIAVIGAGFVGLSVAHSLRQRGADVTVFDREPGTGGGASLGNAGWILPALVSPLPEPAVLRFAARTVLQRRSPVAVSASLRMFPFLIGFARHSTTRSWRKGLIALAALSHSVVDTFDRLHAAIPGLDVRDASPFVAILPSEAHRQEFIEELGHLAEHNPSGRPEPIGSAAFAEWRVRGFGVALVGQKYVDPPRFLSALARGIAASGVEMWWSSDVTHLTPRGSSVEVGIADAGAEYFDSVVVATGAWSRHLIRGLGVRMPVQAGHGYSFSVAAAGAPRMPLYFATDRVAFTPLADDRVRVAGLMDLGRADARFDQRRLRDLAESARRLVPTIDPDSIKDEWMGPRPISTDGLPLLGPTSHPRIHVATGHGMWGLTLAPATGELLADAILTGITPPALRPFAPTR